MKYLQIYLYFQSFPTRFVQLQITDSINEKPK